MSIIKTKRKNGRPLAPYPERGEIFNHLTFLSGSGRSGQRTIWRMECECGVVKDVCAGDVRSGHTTSCGCKKGGGPKTHGLADSREFIAWAGAKGRCLNPNNSRFSSYGGRGIKMCERWLSSFENFIADMGQKPSPKHTLERIDVNGDYSPENCKWATWTEQARNRRKVKLIEFDGRKLPLWRWAEVTGLSRGTIWGRLAKGWTPKDALTTPSQRHAA